jgi:hypothetical protein
MSVAGGGSATPREVTPASGAVAVPGAGSVLADDEPVTTAGAAHAVMHAIGGSGNGVVPAPAPLAFSAAMGSSPCYIRSCNTLGTGGAAVFGGAAKGWRRHVPCRNHDNDLLPRRYRSR